MLLLAFILEVPVLYHLDRIPSWADAGMLYSKPTTQIAKSAVYTV